MFVSPIPLAGNRIWAHSLFSIFLSVCALLQCCLLFRLGRVAIWRKESFWLLPLWLLVVWLLGQRLFISNLDIGAWQISLSKSLLFAVWGHLLSLHLTSPSRLRAFGYTIIATGSVQAFYGIMIQLLDLDVSPVIGMNELERARGSFVYQNHFANFLAISIAVGLGMLLSELSSRVAKTSWRDTARIIVDSLLSLKLILRLCLVLMVIGLVMSHSRMGNAAFFTSLILTGILAICGFYKRPPIFLKPLILSILVLDALIIGSMFGIEKLQQRYEETSFASEARDEVDLDGIKLVQDYPLTGTGAGSFYSVFPNVQSHMYHGFYDHAHNDYLQFAIELGVPATFLLLVWLGCIALKALKTMRTHEVKIARGISFAVIMAIIHMGIHCVVDFNLQAPANAMLFIAIIVLGVNSSYLKPPKRYKQDFTHNLPPH